MTRKTNATPTILVRCDRNRWPELHRILMQQNATFTTGRCEVTEHTSGTVDLLVTAHTAGTISHLARQPRKTPAPKGQDE